MHTSPMPQTLIRTAHRRIASYDASVFLLHAQNTGDRPLTPEVSETVSKKPAVFWIITTSILLAVLLLSIAAAHADPANVSRQATLIRSADKVTFGKQRVQQLDKVTNAAVARLKVLENRRRLARERATHLAPQIFIASKL